MYSRERLRSKSAELTPPQCGYHIYETQIIQALGTWRRAQPLKLSWLDSCRLGPPDFHRSQVERVRIVSSCPDRITRRDSPIPLFELRTLQSLNGLEAADVIPDSRLRHGSKLVCFYRTPCHRKASWSYSTMFMNCRKTS